MKNIKWHSVTWYSRLIALVALVILPFLGFYYGVQYGQAIAYVRSSSALLPTSLDYYHNVSSWQRSDNTQGGFSIAHPLDFPFDGTTLTIPAAFEPQTNFADAKLTVGKGTGCNEAASSTATIDGTEFSVFYNSDAGAGNRYETTSYRTVHGGQCYMIEYTIHSTQIGNYPAQYQLNNFSGAKVIDVMNRIVGTFRFL